MTTNKTNKELEVFKDPDDTLKILKEALQKLAEDGNSETFLGLLRKITKHQGGMSMLSKKIGINRQNLYRTFSSTGNPKFRSLATILKGLGYRISIEPISEEEASSQANDNKQDKAA